ncbi:phage baseplate assembly protein V [Alteromonas sp. a30]|uniref:phage baseplate assembly protein V n=1 Tax=Alteromonas sp. a30 TaxID=2730917 RepID=UPI00227ED851|nr:phage baseplate assembly protein V [Alteromonas sp. a30]MCY7295107.1 phage baseplate assembly protein V [Alteromonas sp. a30]
MQSLIMNSSTPFNVAELNRKMAGLVRFCKVLELGEEEFVGRVKVSDGDLQSTWLAYAVQRAAHNIHWQPLDVGEYVVVLCPNGDFSQGVIIGSLYQGEFPAPQDNAEQTQQLFKDGTSFIFDRAESHFHIAMAPDGTIHIEVSGGATIDGPVTINGNVNINGDTHIVGTTSVDGDVSATKNIHSDAQISATDEVKGGGVSLTKHVHPGVASGGAKTLKPE